MARDIRKYSGIGVCAGVSDISGIIMPKNEIIVPKSIHNITMLLLLLFFPVYPAARCKCFLPFLQAYPNFGSFGSAFRQFPPRWRL